jgi:hypothetical protein
MFNEAKNSGPERYRESTELPEDHRDDQGARGRTDGDRQKNEDFRRTRDDVLQFIVGYFFFEAS